MSYHEPEDKLTPEAIDYHRIIKSVIEELEAVDWYNQRAVATDDPDVEAIVAHNRDEEIEHACMGLEWLRRNSEVWDEMLRTFLFTDAKITEIEEDEMAEGEEEANPASNSNGSLGLGSMRGGE
ncbi:ferritin-like domain-containing protein [Halanaerobium sp. Z-7514]|uniref:Ferritin-like domain-containing protein n=1 Tax=Halanaerobium polyolivorans TaxID=2886943 RepID=A0AAW4WZI5_9FIRM|nr:ferritin-like domain-containing protein [Halanaerobium polyolivorans]MCC3144489.1 ferritin-like domain-containing protein [Halanaerobium polyolivorans]RQD71687.1 MAG: ferritin [Halanaerobium sp. MSAO_Bac5]